ncbi:MAG: DUF6547 family protein [Oculatellaceae cyanobacterium bins.114]|nr:DUF6547 family protein [Oculatellaceae cyanobacterium bins.114]
MQLSLQLYKEFVDGLVNIRYGILSNWVRTNSLPEVSENEKINQLLSHLDVEQREIIAAMLDRARDNGINDVLAYINDEIAIHNLRLLRGEIELAFQPFDTELYYDWLRRADGDVWPDEEIQSR